MTRGEIWMADFGIPFGSEPGFTRPVLIVQDDSFNKSTINTVVILPFTTNLNLENAPGNVYADQNGSGLKKESVIVVSQLYAIDRHRLLEKKSKIAEYLLAEVEEGIKLVVGIN